MSLTYTQWNAQNSHPGVVPLDTKVEPNEFGRAPEIIDYGRSENVVMFGDWIGADENGVVRAIHSNRRYHTLLKSGNL